MKMMVFAALLALLPAAALAGEAEQSAARSVVGAQIEAFLNGDFEKAYTFASPGIRQKFPTLEQFMTMVQRGYQPVFRPGNYGFGRIEERGGEIVLEVLISGPDGKDYTAIYFMERQDDGSWKIAGVNIRQGAAGLI